MLQRSCWFPRRSVAVRLLPDAPRLTFGTTVCSGRLSLGPPLVVVREAGWIRKGAL
jgi:hypothetical protein